VHEPPWRLTLAVTYFRDNNDMRRLLPEADEDGVQYQRRVRDLLIGTFAPARARLHGIAANGTADAWCRVIAEDLDAQVSRGGPRQDIMTHYSAERAWATELHQRCLAATTVYLKIWLGLGLLTLGAWLIDSAAGTAIIAAVRSAFAQCGWLRDGRPGSRAGRLGDPHCREPRCAARKPRDPAATASTGAARLGPARRGRQGRARTGWRADCSGCSCCCVLSPRSSF
jgi:hypothetical protein